MSRKRGATCVRALVYGTGFGFLYPLILLGLYAGFESVPLPIAFIYWGLVKIILAYGVVCLYQLNHQLRYALIGILLFISGVFALYPVASFLVIAIEALALTGFSLVLLDVGRARPESNLHVSGGLIFLGVILTILQSPIMEFVAAALLAIGLLMAATQLMRL